jgi:hypothetical protein
MTDAVSAPGLTEVWTLLVAVVGREPIQLQVALALVVILALLMLIDGVRANLMRRKPQALAIVRSPHVKSVPYVVKTQAARPGRRLAVKTTPRPSKLRPPRPVINRISSERSVAYRSSRSGEPPYEGDGPPL